MPNIITEAVSIKELTKKNKKKFNQRGLNCIVQIVDFERNKRQDLRYVFLIECLESYSHNGGHIVSARFEPDTAKDGLKSRPYNDDCRVHCQCPSFQYWGAAFNATEGDYNLDFAEKRGPDIRDPKREVKICKHISRVSRMLSKMSYSSLDKKAGITVATIEKALERDLNIIPIEETFTSLMGYLEREKKDIDPYDFCANLTRANYEEELLKIGAIV